MFSKYTKIGQFRQLLQTIHSMASYAGKDENGDPVYKSTEETELPVLELSGTVKLHGTNAAIGYNPNKGIWCQSRSQIVTDGHYGFVDFVKQRKDDINIMMASLWSNVLEYQENLDSVYVYGEWAGKGIQSGVAISQLEPSFYIFDIKVKLIDDNEESIWIDPGYFRFPSIDKVYNIADFEQYRVVLDVANPELCSKQIESLVHKVDQKCPVAAYFGIDGHGEGIVWTTTYKNQRLICKTKGDSHKRGGPTGKKTKVELSPAELDSINEFVDYALTKDRYNQCISEVFTDGFVTDDGFGKVIKWMINDIMTEEEDVIIKNMLSKRAVSAEIVTRLKSMFWR